jgi:hypothetical protein
MVESLSDEQLLQLANNYITTDESLKKFQNFNINKENIVKEKEKTLKEKLESINKLNLMNNKSKEKDKTNKKLFQDNDLNLKFVGDGENYKNNNKINLNSNYNQNVKSNTNILRENELNKTDENNTYDKLVENPDLSLKNKNNVMKALNYYNNSKINKKK